MSTFMQSGLFPRLLSILLLLLLWQSMTTLLSSGVLPPPASVFAFVVREAQSGDLVHNLAATMTRVIASFTLAMIIGGAIGLALGRSWRVGWGPGGTLVHLGKLCGPTSSS